MISFAFGHNLSDLRKQNTNKKNEKESFTMNQILERQLYTNPVILLTSGDFYQQFLSLLVSKEPVGWSTGA